MFTISLRKLKEKAYKIDESWLNEPMDLHIKIDEQTYNTCTQPEMRRKYKQLSDSDFKETEKLAMKIRYEDSYIGEYLELYNRRIEDKIKSDFENLQGFFSESNEIAVQGELNVIDVDFENEEVTFEGSHHILASYIINAINGYGAFYYDSLEEFYEVNSAYSIRDQLEAIESHLHWLSYIEEIYGTVFRLFNIDLEDLDRYYVLGDFDYTEEDFEEALDQI